MFRKKRRIRLRIRGKPGSARFLRRFYLGTDALLGELRRMLKGKWEELLGPFLREKAEQEILSQTVILKTIAIAGRKSPMSQEYILELLLESSRAMRGTYEGILYRIRSGKGGEAFVPEGALADSAVASNYLTILSELDRIDPSELIRSIEAFEEVYAQERVTRAMKRAGIRSILVTLISSASVLAVLMNFTVVVVYLNLLEKLGDLYLY